MTKEQALQAVEAFMDSENAARKAGKYNVYLRNGQGYKMAVKAVNNPGTKIRTTSVYVQKQTSHQNEVTGILRGAGVNYTEGNDAPRWGIAGNFVIVNL